MIYLLLGCLVLGAVLGIGGMRRARLYAGGAWRPGAGALAIAAFVGAAALGVRDAWGPALVLAGLGGWLALSARRRAAQEKPAPSAGGNMDLQEASAILGVPPDASPQAVSEAYRRLMQRVHPDKGGASGLAVQLNNARDVMNRRNGPPAGS